MAGIVKSVCMVLIATILVVMVAPRAEAAVTCGTVVQYLNNCIPFVTNKGPLGNCCSGVKGLYGAANTTPDRQAVCGCLKTLAASYSGINYQKIAGIPGQCGLHIPYKINPSTDCSKVK